MVAYANYFTDARIKNYVDALLGVGYEVDVFALGRPDSRPGLKMYSLMTKVWSESPILYLVSQLWFFIVATVLVTYGVFGRRYSLIHVHNIPDFLVFVGFVPRWLGAKVILDIHDTMPESFATKFDLSLTHPLIRAIRIEERASARFAHHVITSNDLHKEALVGHGIPLDKISIIMNVGNGALFHPPAAQEKHAGLTLAYHGTVAERLGLDLVLDALRLARPGCPNLRFLLIGDGDHMPVIRRMIADYDLADVVTLQDWVPVERLPDYLAAADVGVVGNRRYTEARQNWMLPVKMLEYAAMEIPTIAPRLRAIAHYFDAENALLYEPDDAQDLARCISEVYHDPDHLHRLREGLRTFNRRHNWAQMQQRYLELVDTLTHTRL